MSTSESRERLTLNDLHGRLTVTVEEAGDLMGVSRGSAYAAARRGDLPTLNLGRRIVVPTHALLLDVLAVPAERVAELLGAPAEATA